MDGCRLDVSMRSVCCNAAYIDHHHGLQVDGGVLYGAGYAQCFACGKVCSITKPVRHLHVACQCPEVGITVEAVGTCAV